MTAMSLQTFQEELEALIGKPTDLRPFVCDGSPLDCKVFIVGLNPASEMDGDFWDYWDSGRGFDKTRWFEAYKNSRRERPLNPGKKRRNKVSNTRRVIEWIAAGLMPGKILETNSFAKANEVYADLAERNRSTAPFNLLAESLKPAVIVAHGKDAMADRRGVISRSRLCCFLSVSAVRCCGSLRSSKCRWCLVFSASHAFVAAFRHWAQHGRGLSTAVPLRKAGRLAASDARIVNS